MSPLEMLLNSDCEHTNYCQISPFNFNIITKVSMKEVIAIFGRIKYLQCMYYICLYICLYVSFVSLVIKKRYSLK